jgi:hypothetical protein
MLGGGGTIYWNDKELTPGFEVANLFPTVGGKSPYGCGRKENSCARLRQFGPVATGGARSPGIAADMAPFGALQPLDFPTEWSAIHEEAKCLVTQIMATA